MINKLYETTGHFQVFQFAVKYLNAFINLIINHLLIIIYKCISDYNHISPNQSGFRTGDSYVNQLLSIIQDIYYSFNVGFWKKALFLDISKVFVKVWQDRLIYKLHQNGFFKNDQHSSWANIKAG